MKPLLICLTPVRNEKWCLDVFLQATSLWADYIIIADQNSTDGSVDISKKYSKVILINNDGIEYSESNRQKILVSEARKIQGDKILFALDADEIFSANFSSTSDWNKIIDSKPGDVFGLQWANICADKKNCFVSEFYYPWIFHDDNVTEHKNYVREMHSMRIPYPIEADMGYNRISQFKVFHLPYLNPNRLKSKWRFYQFTEIVKSITYNPISAYRSYNQSNVQTVSIPDDWIQPYYDLGLHFFERLDLNERIFWFDEVVIEYINKYDIRKFSKIPVWDKEWLLFVKTCTNKEDPRSLFEKIIYQYLSISQFFYPSFTIKLFDKILRKYFVK